MTRADKWKKRPATTRYWAFKDAVRLLMPKRLDLNYRHIEFGVPMPKSWSKKKKAAMRGKPHVQRPDLDNYLKALFDALYEEDCAIHCLAQVKKVWADKGYLWISD